MKLPAGTHVKYYSIPYGWMRGTVYSTRPVKDLWYAEVFFPSRNGYPPIMLEILTIFLERE